LLRFAVWLVLNRLMRVGRDFDLVISPGINCLDADVVIVHALFRRLGEAGTASGREAAVRPGLLRRLHRHAYYSLVGTLERRVYRDRTVGLVAVSRRTATLLKSYFGRQDVRVIPNGVDIEVFSPASRLARRESARSKYGLRPDELLLLLIGNDWATKGIFTVFEALAALRSQAMRFLIVGGDQRDSYVAAAESMQISDRCTWQAPTSEILDCYGAADVYVSPSREDSFGMPVLEAMACGLPVITSASAGVSELVQDAANGFVLQDPRDGATLALLITRLYTNPSFRTAIGEAASRTAQEWTWARHAGKVWQFLSTLKAR
jgi:glycosyltransferase involved in cell wall biosynthesis